MIHRLLTECALRGTYRDENAVRVFGLAGLVCAHEVGQALDVVDAHHVDVVVEAESLDEREVDLKSDVTLVLVVGGEDAECHAVRITVGGKTQGRRSVRVPLVAYFGTRQVRFERVEHGDTYTFMTLADS